MLGLRGCRLGIVHPEISEMQARAIIEAALNVKAKGVVAMPDIMVPLVGTVKELEHQAALIRRVAAAVFEERKDTVAYRVGTMIEIPRAALLADDIAKASPPPPPTPSPPPFPRTLKLSGITRISSLASDWLPLSSFGRWRTSSPSAPTT